MNFSTWKPFFPIAPESLSPLGSVPGIPKWESISPIDPCLSALETLPIEIFSMGTVFPHSSEHPEIEGQRSLLARGRI